MTNALAHTQLLPPGWAQAATGLNELVNQAYAGLRPAQAALQRIADQTNQAVLAQLRLAVPAPAEFTRISRMIDDIYKSWMDQFDFSQFSAQLARQLVVDATRPALPAPAPAAELVAAPDELPHVPSRELQPVIRTRQDLAHFALDLGKGAIGVGTLYTCVQGYLVAQGVAPATAAQAASYIAAALAVAALVAYTATRDKDE